MIQKNQSLLTLQEQKCILFVISKIKPTDTVFKEYTFDLGLFSKMCGIQDDSYTTLKRILMGLKQKSWWIEPAPGVESIFSWFSKVWFYPQKGIVTVRLDDDLMPYLLQLAEQGVFYTHFKLQYILPMRCYYSPRLYELLKSYQKNNYEWFFDVDELKRLLDCQNYRNFNDFKKRVLDPAMDEINRYTDIRVTYEVERRGRKVVRVIFFMAPKSKEDVISAINCGIDDMGVGYMDKLISENSVRRKFWKSAP